MGSMTLGQIAYEAWLGDLYGTPWNEKSKDLIAEWEAAAQAVRAAVIEECAKVCDRRALGANNSTVGRMFEAQDCAAAIRSLK
jgi:hypothetical protein